MVIEILWAIERKCLLAEAFTKTMSGVITLANENQNRGQGKNEQPQPQPQPTQSYNAAVPTYRPAGYPMQQTQTQTHTHTPTYPYTGTVAPSPYPAAPPPQTQGFQGYHGGMPTSPSTAAMPLPAMQQSYIENILRMNLEKVATVYMTFEHEGGAESKAFRGEIEAAGRDHVIINDNKTGTRYLLPLIYLDYVTFQGPINYAYPFG